MATRTTDEETHVTDIAETWRETLPHRSFKLRIDDYAGVSVIAVECACGRAWPFLGSLDSRTLARWLADHDEEIFLTAEEIRTMHEAKIDLAHVEGVPLPYPPGPGRNRPGGPRLRRRLQQPQTYRPVTTGPDTPTEGTAP
jgi:hypothetical protein